MENKSLKLLLIKTVHTLVWIFFNGILFYLFYAVITDKIDIWVWICIALFAIEGLTLLIFENICPLTLVARKFSNSEKDNFDIFLPSWLARYNKLIYSILLGLAILLVIYRLIS
jgi:hypothetical protein